MQTHMKYLNNENKAYGGYIILVMEGLHWLPFCF